MSDSLHPNARVLNQLESAKIYHRIMRVPTHENNVRTIVVEAHVPGRRYEIEVFPDGLLKVETYKSDGKIRGQEALDELVREFSDDNAAKPAPRRMGVQKRRAGG